MLAGYSPSDYPLSPTTTHFKTLFPPPVNTFPAESYSKVIHRSKMQLVRPSTLTPFLHPSRAHEYTLSAAIGPLTFGQMRAADFDYALPPELIAQHPAPARDHSQLLVLDRNTGALEHRRFFALPEFLRAGDILVLNDSRVIPARLRGVHATTGSPLEILLLEENSLNDWWAMLRPGKRARDGTKISLLDPEKNHSAVSAVVAEINAEGHRRLKFSGTENILHELERLGEVTLAPYIERPQQSVEDRDRYQTVYAGRAGSVAAPTAGLHFTTALLDRKSTRLDSRHVSESRMPA